METKYNYELIKDYLDGTLESKTGKEVESLLREDEVARDIAKGILLLNEQFQQDNERIERYLDQLLAKRINKISSHQVTDKWLTFLKVAAAVALLIMASFSIYNFSSPDPEEYLEAQLAEPYQAPSVTRSGEEANQIYLSGIAFYENQQYQEAWSRLSTLDNPVSIFYSGLSKLYLEDYHMAIEMLTRDELQTSVFNQHSKWFLSLAYLKTDEKDKAMFILDELSESGGFKSEEAGKLKKLLVDRPL